MLWSTVGAVLAMLVMLGGLVVWWILFPLSQALEHLAYPIDSERTRMTVSAAILHTTQC